MYFCYEFFLFYLQCLDRIFLLFQFVSGNKELCHHFRLAHMHDLNYIIALVVVLWEGLSFVEGFFLGEKCNQNKALFLNSTILKDECLSGPRKDPVWWLRPFLNNQ